MNSKPLTLQEQITVCQQVARLVHARLPLASHLSEHAQGYEAAGKKVAERVEAKISDGQSLSDAIAQDDSLESRVLAACIQAGEQSDSLDHTLKNWAAMHIENSRSSKAFATAMLYPMLLVVIVVLSIGFLIWQLVPEYKTTYLLYENELPAWLETLLAVRSNFAFVVIGMLLVTLVPPIMLWWRARGYQPSGLPRSQSAADRQQALGCDLAATLFERQLPLDLVARYSALACGASTDTAEQAFEKTRNQEEIEPLPVELSAVLSSVHGGALSALEASKALRDVAGHLRDSAHNHSVRRARWLPMLVALCVGLVTVLTYTFLIYLPWIWLMQEISAPENMRIQYN